MGGSGGSAGSVSYAAYLEEWHGYFMSYQTSAYIENDTMADMLNDAFNVSGPQAPNGNPYLNQTAYSPDTALGNAFTAIEDFEASVDVNDIEALTDEVDAYDDELTRQLDQEVIPKFNISMRDLGFVQSSTFAIGRAGKLAEKGRKVSDYEAKLRLEWQQFYQQTQQNIITMKLDAHKITIVSKYEEELRDSEIEALAAGWRIESLSKGGQYLGLLGGGIMLPDKPSKAKSAVAMGLAVASGVSQIYGTWSSGKGKGGAFSGEQSTTPAQITT